ncbi:MAG: MATE family efflux transporter [Lachnospirales bacterium]
MVKENKMATMPVGKLLLSMALPMMISMLVQAMYNIVDSMFVAQIDPAGDPIKPAFSAISMVFPLQTFMISVGTGLGVGINAILSRYLGAKDSNGVNRTALNGIFLAFIGYIIFLIIGIFAVKGFMRFQTTDEKTIMYGTQYLRIICVFGFGFFTQMTFERLLQATGKTIFCMITQMTGAIINIVLDPILIFGLLGAPRLEMMGAAIATVIGQCCAAILAVIFNFKINKEIPFKIKGFRPSSHTMLKILYIGIPSILMASIGSIMTLGMNKILIGFSSIAVAVFGAYFKLQSFIFMPVFGLNNGMVPIVAFSLGARKKDRLIKTIKYSVAFAFLLMLIGFTIFQTSADKLLLIFNADENMLKMGVPALKTISYSFLVAGFCIINLSVFQALGNGILSMAVSFMRQLVVLLPTAYLLSRTGVLEYVWYSFLIAEIASVTLSGLGLRYMYKKVISKI